MEAQLLIQRCIGARLTQNNTPTGYSGSGNLPSIFIFGNHWQSVICHSVYTSRKPQTVLACICHLALSFVELLSAVPTSAVLTCVVSACGDFSFPAKYNPVADKIGPNN